MTTKTLTQSADTFANDGVTNNFTIVNGLGGNDVLSTAVAATINGGDGNDSITSTVSAGATVASNDYLFGGNGDDTITGGAGNDTMYGGLGNDVLSSGNGKDALYGGIGNDSLTGGQGNQALYGGVGLDTLYGGVDSNALTGGAVDTHILYGDAGNDNVTGGGYTAGTNNVASSASNSYKLYGGVGNDTLTGSWIVVGSAGAKDTMDGGVGINSINGGSSISATGATVVVGANHANETLTFINDTQGVSVGVSLWAGVTANLTTGVATASGKSMGSNWSINDTIANIDNLTGSNYNDSLTGNTFANVILGGAGNDTITGGGSGAYGSPTANTGNDTLNGGGGNDTYILNTGSDTVNAMIIQDNSGINTLDFSNVAVTLGTAEHTPLVTGDTLKALSASASAYTIGMIEGVQANLGSAIDANGKVYFTGNAGSGSILGVQHLIGTAGADYLVGVGGSTLDGGAGNDTLVAAGAATGAEVLNGGAGNNVYDATAGGATVYFGVSNDKATTLVTAATVNKEFDTIYGFNGNANHDMLYVSAANFNNFGLAIAQTHAAGNVDVGGMFTEHYNTAGKLASLTLDATAVTTVAALPTATGTLATHDEFVYVSGTGDLFYVKSGQDLMLTGTTYVGGTSAGGALTASNNAIAHIDLGSFQPTTSSGNVHHTTAVIDNTDFFLVQ